MTTIAKGDGNVESGVQTKDDASLQARKESCADTDVSSESSPIAGENTASKGVQANFLKQRAPSLQDGQIQRYSDLPIVTLEFKQIPSTHRWVSDHLDDLVRQSYLSFKVACGVFALEQTGGIGTHDSVKKQHRKWISPPGNVYMTIAVPWPASRVDCIKNAPLVAGAAITEVLQRYGMDAKARWINDIHIKERKVGGVLCSATCCVVEDADHDEGLRTVAIISAGVNCVLTEAHKKEVGRHDGCATTVEEEMNCIGKTAPPMKELREEILRSVYSAVVRLCREGFDAGTRQWVEKNMASIGKLVEFRCEDGTSERGTLHGVDAEGAAILERSDGSRRSFFTAMPWSEVKESN